MTAIDPHQFAAHLTLAGLSDNTVRNYRALFIRWCDWAHAQGHDPMAPDPLAARAWTGTLTGSRETIGQARAVIGHLCRALGVDDVSTAIRLPRAPKRKPRPIELDATRKLMAAALSPGSGLRGTATLLALTTAARRAEIAGMAWEGVDFGGRAITFWRPKTRDWHNVMLADVLAGHLAERADGRERWLFPGKWGGHVHPTTIAEWVTSLARDAGVGHVPTHRLRHTALTHAYAVTKDIRAVQLLAGHAQLNTTAIYTLVSDNDLRAAVGTLNEYRDPASYQDAA